MEHLWAPWRIGYVTAPKEAGPADDCFLCRGLAESNDRDNLIALRTDSSAIVLNRFPYNNGHVLIAPKEHKATPGELTDDETLDLQRLLVRVVGAYDRTMKPDGYNVGLNLGKVAGAGLPGHLHWHVVPRWNGDTNFMPILGDTRVIVQSLEALYDLLTTALK